MENNMTEKADDSSIYIPENELTNRQNFTAKNTQFKSANLPVF